MRNLTLIAAIIVVSICLCCAGVSSMVAFGGFARLLANPRMDAAQVDQILPSEATSLPQNTAAAQAPEQTVRPSAVPTQSPSTDTPTETPAPLSASPSEIPTGGAGDTFLPYQSSTGGNLADCLPVGGKAELATVVRVIDGDTIEVQIGEAIQSVRYIGVDSPETDFPLGAEALANNASLVEGKEVLMIPDVSDTDRYSRLLRYVIAGEVFVNEALVRTGYAMSKGYPPDIACQELFDQAEQEAKAAGLGLWAEAVTPTQLSPGGITSGESPSVVIWDIFFDGVVKQVESDEYAVITNQGVAPIDLAGWRLNAGNPGQDFIFPAFFLEPGQSCRVYTNESHADHCGFTFSSRDPLWNNKGDCGYLYNLNGEMVSDFCY